MSQTLDQKIITLEKKIKRAKETLRRYDRNLDDDCKHMIERIGIDEYYPYYFCGEDNPYDEELQIAALKRDYEKKKMIQSRIDIPGIKKELAENQKKLEKYYKRRKNMSKSKKTKMKNKSDLDALNKLADQMGY